MKATTATEKAQSFALVMKHITQFTIALAILGFSMAAILFSTTPAQADAGPQVTSSTGKYMMSLSVVNTNADQSYWYVIVWNTETGRSKFYYGSTKKGTVAAGGSYNLPSNPL